MKVILVVDDDATNLRTLGELLRPEYRVRLASSGEDALRIAGSDPRPDLILLDVMMPVMDGYEVLRRLRADEATRAIPVVFVTALHDDDSEQRGFELGAADFIHKPIRAAVALSRIRAQIDARTARESLRRKALHMARMAEQGAEQLESTRRQLLQSEIRVLLMALYPQYAAPTTATATPAAEPAGRGTSSFHNNGRQARPRDLFTPLCLYSGSLYHRLFDVQQTLPSRSYCDGKYLDLPRSQ